MELKDIKFDKHNYRKHSAENQKLIKKSLEETGFGRSVLIDSENCLIAGNGVVSQLPKNTKIKVVETDGTEMVVVKRTDLKTEDRKRKELARNDNATANNVEWENEELKADFSADELKAWGIDMGQIVVENDDTYTKNVNIPQYEVTGEKPKVKDLYNDEKCKNLVFEIENSNLSDEEKNFLIKAASRHIVFNYRNIAEFYANASKECQELMEKSALVIIDYDNALRNGYIELNEEMDKLLENNTNYSDYGKKRKS